MTVPDPIDIDELKRLHERATKAPWHPVRSMTCGHLRAQHNHQIDPRKEWTDADMELIAAARNALPALLARVEEGEKERDRIREFGVEVNAIRKGCISFAVQSASGSTEEHDWTTMAARLLVLQSKMGVDPAALAPASEENEKEK